jgi:hypothetical protein
MTIEKQDTPEVASTVPVNDNKPPVAEKKSAPAPVVPAPPPAKPAIQKYRLNVYRNGLVRSEISRGMFHDMSAKYGDIMRSVSSSKWMTIDEIVDNYWAMERRLKFEMGRTRKKIVDAVNELVATTLIETR